MAVRFAIKGFVGTSFLDWPGRICSVVFLGGCSFRCPSCHNPRLVVGVDSIPDFPLAEILRSLEQHKSWIDGVTITGGEPTIHRRLPHLLRLLRWNHLPIKLDTNGSNPELLERLIAERLIDAVFMDVKAPLLPERYSRVAGVAVDLDRIRQSIAILKRSGLPVTFRTTVIPGLVEEPEVDQIRKALGEVERFTIQSFRATETLDPALGSIPEFPPERVADLKRRFEAPSPGAVHRVQPRVSQVG